MHSCIVIAAAPLSLAALDHAPEVSRRIVDGVLDLPECIRGLVLGELNPAEDGTSLELEIGARFDVQEDLAVARNRKGRRERRRELRSARGGLTALARGLGLLAFGREALEPLGCRSGVLEPAQQLALRGGALGGK